MYTCTKIQQRDAFHTRDDDQKLIDSVYEIKSKCNPHIRAPFLKQLFTDYL